MTLDTCGEVVSNHISKEEIHRVVRGCSKIRVVTKRRKRTTEIPNRPTRTCQLILVVRPFLKILLSLWYKEVEVFCRSRRGSLQLHRAGYYQMRWLYWQHYCRFYSPWYRRLARYSWAQSGRCSLLPPSTVLPWPTSHNKIEVSNHSGWRIPSSNKSWCDRSVLKTYFPLPLIATYAKQDWIVWFSRRIIFKCLRHLDTTYALHHNKGLQPHMGIP
jgi:hypothetical protein